MTDEISPEVFAHLVELASFELEPQNAEYLRNELNHQLKAIHELEAIPLDEKMEISTHGVAYPPSHRQPIREDTHLPFSENGALTSQMPQFEDGYVIVPDIPHQTLE